MTIDSLKVALAPTGTLRVGINYGNPVLAGKDIRTGELGGLAVDLARELATRAGVPLELVGFEAAGRMFAALQAGTWDVAFLAIDPGRADVLDFTAAYVEIEGTYLVPPGSGLRKISDVDREDVRVGVSANSAYDLFLRRSLQRARLVHAPDPNAAFQLLLDKRVDAVAGVRQHLLANASRLSGSRVFDGRFMAIEQALGIPKGRGDGAVRFLRQFIEEAKASGLVARLLEKSGVRGVSVAPPAQVP